MKITEQNREQVKAFARILINIGVSQLAGEMIVAMLKTKEQMDATVRYIEKNLRVTEEQLLEQVAKIVEG